MRRASARRFVSSASTRTPIRSSVLVIGLVLVFALWLPLLVLARLTSAIILIVFSLVNLALVRIKLRSHAQPGVHAWPIWVPAAGFVLSLAFVAIQLWASLSGAS